MNIEFCSIFLYNSGKLYVRSFVMEVKQVLIKDLYRNESTYIGSTIQVSGWVKTLRDSKNFGFIELNDGSFFKNIQIVFDSNLSNFEAIRKLSKNKYI